MTDEHALIERVAARLAGRPVEVRMRRPPYSTALGSAHKAAGGRAVIYVEPNLTSDMPYRVYLHELAHLRLHWQHMPEQGHESRPGGSIPSDPKRRLGAVIGQPVESQADQLAAKWARYADEHAEQYFYRAGEDRITARLMALEHYTERGKG